MDFDKRKEIINFISENPGSHLREISRKMNTPLSTLNYHINYLLKEHIIEAKLLGRFKRYWLSNTIGCQEKELLAVLRSKTASYIVTYIFLYYIASQIELSKELEIHPAAINFHLKKLIKHEIIEEASYNNGLVKRVGQDKFIKRQRANNEVFYRLKTNIPKKLVNLILVYNKSLSINIFFEFINFYGIQNLGKTGSENKIIKNNMEKDIINNIINTAFEIFPNPFCV